MEEAVKDMLKTGVIERSESPWSFPIVVVDKKDCVDFRKLNVISKTLPLIDNILLGKAHRSEIWILAGSS